MNAINMLDAKSSLSRLVELGAEAEIVIARNGRPPATAARLVALAPPATGKRIGAAKGKFKVPDSIDTDAAVIAAMLAGSPA